MRLTANSASPRLFPVPEMGFMINIIWRFPLISNYVNDISTKVIIKTCSKNNKK
jgi:hypothetical protein